MERAELRALIASLEAQNPITAASQEAAALLRQLLDLRPTAWYDPRWPDKLDNDDAFADFPIWEWVPLYTLPIEPATRCSYCEKFFAQYRCNAPEECDCPKCQGMCECPKDPE